MGMDLRISSIKNEKAKTAAYQIDNGDGILKKEELSLFQQKAFENGVKDRHINVVLDHFNREESTEEASKENKTKKEMRKEEKAQKKAESLENAQTIAQEIKGEEGRYTQEVLDETKAKLKEDGKLDKQERQALKTIRQTAAANDGQEVILDAVMAQKNTEIEGTSGNTQTISGQDVVTNEDLTKRRSVKKEAKADLKESGAWDDKVVREEWRKGKGKEFFTGETSFVNSAARIQATQNDVEQSAIQTTEEVMENLETDSKMELLSTINNKEIAKRDANGKPIDGETIKVAYKDENGNWHFDGLSQEIEHFIGADLKLNRDAKKDKLVAEFNKIHGRLNLLTGQQLSKNEVRELVRLCGFEIEDKDWRRVVAGALTGSAIGAGAGASGADGDQPVIVKDQLIQVSDYIDITSIADITKDTTIKIPGGTLIIPGNIGTATALGMIIPAVIGALNGLKDVGQKPVVPQNFSATNPQELIEELKSENNPYAEIYGALALAFRTQDADGKVTGWDREGFKDFLNDIAGNGNGLLNKEELLGASMRIKDGEIEVKEPEVEPKEICAVEITENTPMTEHTEDITYIHYRKGGDSWAGIVTAYYPELVAEFGIWGKDGAIKRLQRALATDENGNYNAETFRAIITATDLPKEMKLPSQIDGKVRVDGKVKAVKFTTGGHYKAALDKVGNNEYYVTQIPGSTTYIARDLCDNSTASGSSREEAFANLKKQNPEKQYQLQ